MKRLGLLFPLTLLTVACQSHLVNDETHTPLSEQQTVKLIKHSANKTVSFNNQVQDASAHWLAENLLVMTPTQEQPLLKKPYSLMSSINGKIRQTPLTAINLPKWVTNKHPHLANAQAFSLDLPIGTAKQWLKHPVFVQATNQPKSKISFVQTGEVLDAIYTKADNDANEEQQLGATLITSDEQTKVQFKLWAPTAKQVTVKLFNQDKTPLKTKSLKTKSLALVEDENTGIWHGSIDSITAGDTLDEKYYQYQIDVYHPATQRYEQITTTDPYSLSLSTNSQYSQIVDLSKASTQPKGWNNQQNVALNKPEDAILYEVHIRDFSATDKALSNPSYRGKYKAFTEQNSDGIKHIKRLKKAGLNHIHLLPAFDIGTVNEAPEQSIDLTSTLTEVCQVAPKVSLCQSHLTEAQYQQSLGDILSSYDVASVDAQALVTELKTFDLYNWGYDPFHYTVPEGSYATNADGTARIIEFREMVQNLHNLGFRVIMDVVYNHTHQARMERTAVLDKIVPNYYQRLNPITGNIEQSTCCDNTATERTMMAKLMTDSLVVWARDYKVDGFRFDLMGHQPKDAMLTAREAVRKIDPDTYFYGEGWNFGEVANNSQFVQASQLELSGTEIGTFSDRLRDAIRGPGMSVSGNDIRRNQGIGNGLMTKPNELNLNDASNAPDYYLLMDQARIGLAGNLKHFPLTDRNDQQVTGEKIPYGGQPTGYALDPADTINYISKHDNQTLWDNNQYRNAFDLTTAERVRLHNQSLSFALLAQGIPFLHMGSELLRSKSFLRDSYDYSDWFNRVDFSKQNNFYNVGLPPAEKDQANWSLIKTLFEKNQGRDIVQPSDISFASEVFAEFMSIRSQSGLFNLGTAEEIINQVSFLNTGKNQQLGIIAMRVTQSYQANNNEFTEFMVIFNTSPNQQHFASSLADGYQLHPVQATGVDNVTKESKAMSQGFSIPAFTTAVFVKPKR